MDLKQFETIQMFIMKGSTENRTQIVRVKVWSDNHYTMEPRMKLKHYSMSYSGNYYTCLKCHEHKQILRYAILLRYGMVKNKVLTTGTKGIEKIREGVCSCLRKMF